MEKGKGRAASIPTSNGKQKSITSRIADSASSLAKDIISSGNAASSTAALASTPLAPGKRQPVPSSAQWVENHPAGVSTSRPFLNGGESFRSGKNGSSGRVRDEDVESIDVESQIDLAGASMSTAPLNGDTRLQRSSWIDEYHSMQNISMQNISMQILESQDHTKADAHAYLSDVQQSNVRLDDGTEVIQLLSGSSLVDKTNDADLMTGLPEPSAEELFGEDAYKWQNSAETAQFQLSPAPVHGNVSTENPRNLLPDFQGSSAEEAMLWISDWKDVLNSYTDEVWGTSLPSVQAAKAEIEELRNSSNLTDGKAVRRLGMILGHIQMPSYPPLQSTNANGKKDENAQTARSASNTSATEHPYLRSEYRDDSADYPISASKGHPIHSQYSEKPLDSSDAHITFQDARNSYMQGPLATRHERLAKTMAIAQSFRSRHLHNEAEEAIVAAPTLSRPTVITTPITTKTTTTNTTTTTPPPLQNANPTKDNPPQPATRTATRTVTMIATPEPHQQPPTQQPPTTTPTTSSKTNEYHRLARLEYERSAALLFDGPSSAASASASASASAPVSASASVASSTVPTAPIPTAPTASAYGAVAPYAAAAAVVGGDGASRGSKINGQM